MKKLLALVLALCMALAALPVLAESAGEEKGGTGLGSKIAGFLGIDNLDEVTAFLKKVSALKDKFKGEGADTAAIKSALKKQLAKLLGTDDVNLETVLAWVQEKLGIDVSDVMGFLMGGPEGGSPESSEEDLAELRQDIEERNAWAEAETGEGVPDKKEAESVEEFYGDWIWESFTTRSGAYDMTDTGLALHIAENECYFTADDEVAHDDGEMPVVQEVKLDSGLLKVKTNDSWNVYALTTDNRLVEIGQGMLSYYSPAK